MFWHSSADSAADFAPPNTAPTAMPPAANAISTAAAAPANIRSHHGNYPGIIVFTDKRLFAASGMPGIRRIISLPLKELRECRDLKSPLSYTISLAANTDSFSAMLSPQAGKTTRPFFQLSKELSQGVTLSSLSSCPGNALFR